MKKHLIVLFLIIYTVFSSFLLFSTSNTEETYSNLDLYGKIITNNCTLLKTPSKIENYTNVYFLLEESYFVKINHEQEDYYYVSYMNINGYVNKKDIELVNQQISSPYLNNITFDVIKPCFLQSSPENNESAQLLQLSPQTNVKFIGKIYGDEIYKNSGDVWYYCQIDNLNQTINGYIHSSNTNNLSPITQNSEITTEYISKSSVDNILNLNLSTQTILIIIVSLPVIFLTLILIKGFKKY